MSSLYRPRADAEERADIVFFEALKLMPDERGAFLDRECEADAALREEVNALLLDHAEAGTFLSDDGPLPVELEAHFIRCQVEDVGSSIGPYKLCEQIGEGGFGTVWMAEQEKPMHRRVALKIIKPGMDTKGVSARFERERQALAMMDHPNIATVFDAGATPSGRPFVVMELVRGIKITEYCKQAHLPIVERLKLFIQVCHAVQHAHQKGIIHRDLKPSNILVTLHDGTPVPKVIDFGVAKAIAHERSADQTVFTRFAEMIGTPTYMSPEQAEMSGLDIDTRSDIYSLGVLLYELLTETTPFDAKELISIGIDAMRRTICEIDPPKPSTRLSASLTVPAVASANARSSIVNSESSIDSDLDWIVMKALEKDRTRRYETASGFALDIQRHLASVPVTARPPSVSYRFRKMVRRNRVAFAAGTTVFCALIAGLGISSWMFFKEKETRKRAVAAEKDQGRLRQLAEIQEKNATTEAGKSRQVAEFLKEMLRGVGPWVAKGRDTTILKEILDKTSERIGGDLKDQPAVEAELRSTLGGVYHDLGELEKASTMHSEALAIRQKLFGSDSLLFADSLLNLSRVRYQQAIENHAPVLLDEAESFARDALEIRVKLLGREHLAVTDALYALGCAVNEHGRPRLVEAESIYREALAIRRKLLGDEDTKVASVLTALAHNLGWQDHKRNEPEGEKLLREAVAIYRKQPGHEDSTIYPLHYLARSLILQDKPVEAEPVIREALEMATKVFGKGHWTTINQRNVLRSALGAQGRWEEAEAIDRESLNDVQKSFGNEHAAVATAMYALANSLQYEGKLAEAERFQREALAIRRRLLGNEHRETADSLYDLAFNLGNQGRTAEVQPLLREAFAVRKKLFGPRHEKTLEPLELLYEIVLEPGKLGGPEKLESDDAVLLALAERLYRKGEYAKSEPLYRSVIANRRDKMPAESPTVIDNNASLARLLADWAWSERASSGDVQNAQPKIAERAHEAENLLRACLAMRQRGEEATHWRTAGDIPSRLGGALLAVAVTDSTLTPEGRTAKLAEAETLLIQANEILQSDKSVGRWAKSDSLTRLIRLYQAWDQPVKAMAWQRKLDAFENATVPPTATPENELAGPERAAVGPPQGVRP
jgi:serine/threonine protein kinase/tetratricopeptide (TPR) repeat protein